VEADCVFRRANPDFRDDIPLGHHGRRMLNKQATWPKSPRGWPPRLLPQRRG
jgi:hypothetical protein